VADYSEEEWEGIAIRWREAAGLNVDGRFDAPSFIRWLKRNGCIKDYVCVPAADLPTCEGKFEPEEGRIYYRQTTWRGAEQGNPHDIWTLVHEASHAILKHAETRLRAPNSNKAVRSRRGAKDEVDANRLTASILAPFDKADFMPGMTATDISTRFGLSREAAEKRLKEFERIYRQRNGLPRPLPPGIIDFLQTQRRKGYPVTSISDATVVPLTVDKRYEGEACPNCSEFKLVRIGLRMKCDACSSTTGED
jgi:IrrE N-terminal-like domain